VERLLPAFRRCVTPTSWRGRWAPARPRPSGRSIVARAVAAILDDPAPHIGNIYNLTGPESADLNHYARVFSEALGRTIRYRDASTSEWSEKLRAAGLPEHVVHHLTMTELHKQGRYNRMSEGVPQAHGRDADEHGGLRETPRHGIHAAMRPTTAVLHASPPRGEGFRVFTNGRYRRRNAQFTFTAVNREVR
jgi:hypothetical protein